MRSVIKYHRALRIVLAKLVVDEPGDFGDWFSMDDDTTSEHQQLGLGHGNKLLGPLDINAVRLFGSTGNPRSPAGQCRGRSQYRA